MKIVVAIDSFKSCLSSREAGEAAALGVRRALAGATVVVLPVSDGGEGMLDAFTSAINGEIRQAEVHDPLGREVIARYGVSPGGSTAIIESAQAVGFAMLNDGERDLSRLSSSGVGELVKIAAKQGCRRLIIGLGGTATCDCGRGLLEALGLKITADGKVVTSSLIDLREVEIILAADVNNPLCGANGAARVYAPQKGATPREVELLDERARRFADACAEATGRDCSTMPGAGAAGGLGYAFMQFFGARMCSGIELLLSILDFDGKVADAALVITGEGRADRQTLMGKLPAGILKRAAMASVPVALVAGQVEDRRRLLDAGFCQVECINPPQLPLQKAMLPEVARQNITTAVSRICKNIIT